MQIATKQFARLLVLLVPVLAAAVIAENHEPVWHEHASAYELAREAVRRGEALPLPEVRKHLQKVAPGKIVATHYEYEFDRWVYEFKIVDPQGQLRKVHIDARSGELVLVSDY
ncbi:MAG: PepSY domain-containing protein [Chromatiales bacterium]|jgi:uncharacterized membrane protein YkoI